MNDVPAPKLYTELAGWFHLLTPPEEYTDEADQFRRLILEACPDARTVLELGSGGGNNAFHLKHHFDLTLTDLSDEMLAVSRSINPECEHVQGDMRTLRLGRTFDAVFVHDAVDYMLTEDDVRAALTTVAEHCRPGGVAVVVPDHVQETFASSTEHGGHDEDDSGAGNGGRGLRYLMWTWDPDPGDQSFRADFAYLLRDGDEISVVHDRHICGLFPRAMWTEALEEAGFRVEVRAAEYDEGAGMEIFVGVKQEN
jgi:SAM-dependent methyltransferase